MAVDNRQADASEESLHRIFTVPEAPDSTLGRIEKEISENLNAFLQTHIAAREKPLAEIEKDFLSADNPGKSGFRLWTHAFLIRQARGSVSTHLCAELYWSYDIGTTVLFDAIVKDHDWFEPEPGQNWNVESIHPTWTPSTGDAA